ncbi:TPA: hypothetical protein RG680_000158 [Morganella morganii]|uniref:hypothetical protein n=1 Tax=Morganella morganii TaxID=582 RepID=UPI001BDB1610|nr:hypothetical protein [Morganella morganii]MBT0305839.1 hypothetical protein [Morganella morganii subsp. morganii]HDU8601431.1 hypothetical protein [Morganella morganii]HDU8696404.1 hypothetical protein [Morganella morganii subsp. morganii]HEJ0090434.1 hypothetical protein [Morganella morganii]HEJ0263610.1 hypothetical protein [Morganella morganii]
MEKETWALMGAASAVAVPLIYNTVKEAIWETKKRKREERYIVMQLIFMLDKYISQCEFLSYNDGIYDPEKEYKVTGYVKPELQLSSVKGDYKYLDADMLYRLYSIDSKCAQVISELSNLDDSYFDDAPDCTGYYARRQELYAKHGLYVIELSENICRKFRIKHVSWEGGFNPAVSIRERLVQIRASKSRANLRRMEMKAKRVAEKQRKLLQG